VDRGASQAAIYRTGSELPGVRDPTLRLSLKATADGLHRKPILYVFGAEYAPAFITANKRGRMARGGDRRDRRPITPATSSWPSTTILEGRRNNSPKNSRNNSPKNKQKRSETAGVYG
jgi:hypothetical protein